MKPKQILYLFVLAVVFTGCLPENEPFKTVYYSELGTVENPTSSSLFTFICDNGYRYVVKETEHPNFKPESDTRMTVAFNLLSENEQTRQYEIRLVGGLIFETKNLLPLTRAVADTVGNDPVSNVQLYIASHFLNINYRFNYFDLKHSFNVVRDSIIADNSQDTIKLEFRHNAYGDLYTNSVSNTLCFDISELQHFSINPDSVPVVVSVKEGQITKKYNLIYNF